MTVLLDGLLALLVLAAGLWTIATRETFSAVVGFVAYGLLLSLLWVRLAAVDVALTEAAVGGGVTGVLLVGAAARLRSTQAAAEAENPSRLLRAAAAILCVAVSGGLAAVVLLLPDPAPSLAEDAASHLAALDLGNPVTAVLVAYRAWDTLLEAVVLALAVVAVWSLAPDRMWGGVPGPGRGRAAADSVLTFLAQMLPPVGIVVGIHLVWTGALHPGGAFQGGTVIAAMWILAVMAGLTTPPPIGRRWLRLAVVIGPALFLAIGLAGFAVADGFLAYPAGIAKPLMILIEAALTLSIAVSLGLLVFGPPQRAPEP